MVNQANKLELFLEDIEYGKAAERDACKSRVKHKEQGKTREEFENNIHDESYHGQGLAYGTSTLQVLRQKGVDQVSNIKIQYINNILSYHYLPDKYKVQRK